MTRTERLEFIAKLRLAKKFALARKNSVAIWWGCASAQLLWDRHVMFAPGEEYENRSEDWLLHNGATAKNIAAVFDNSIAAQEKLL